MTTHNKGERGNAVLWILGLVALGVIAYFVFRTDRPVTVPEPAGQVGGVNTSQEVVTEGEVVCLPHRDTSGPTTLECAYGLKANNGTYYGLDTTALSPNTPPEYEVGDRISVEGAMLGQAQIPSNFWQTYNVAGMIAVTDFWKFTEK